jgi:SAM-dependent methyltransferase
VDTNLQHQRAAPSRGTPEASNKRADCPNCGAVRGLFEFYEATRIPVHSVLLMETRKEALAFPKGDLLLTYCRRCGFVFNRLFNAAAQEYSARYEETQGFSETFNSFSDRLARDLIERHSLPGKRVIEIGCGKGEFLTHLCELGQCTGIGFDPAYVPTRTRAKPSERVTFIVDFYSEKYADIQGDFICCKMTLEHISETDSFIKMIRQSVSERPDTIIFFQVPDITRVLAECAFWDIYYEHCSYFSAESLRHLFQHNGFEVLNVWNDYGGQYLMIEARPGTASGAAPGEPTHLSELTQQVDRFASEVESVRQKWASYLRAMKENQRTVALWGGGSKAVAFLTTLGITSEVSCAVDINPHKHGTFLPGTGHGVISPETLRDVHPDAVIVMNPIYCDEIARVLASLGLNPGIVPVTACPDTNSRPAGRS